MSTLGYIVLNESAGETLCLLTHDNSLWNNIPTDGLLLHDSRQATVFPSRRAARAAITRSKAYFVQRAVVEGKPCRIAEDELTIRKLVA